ncbi:uncharacterized protein LOC105188831 isoform X3 [Harpegnathos saltator]|uniref:uncharacterized protein LOC105188831 isoform X3 n=1 Tax=Harpegnathos saltator TaxID=610380 RepID=UPI000DBEDEE3|nr:uncharacterized protein LOC105188831 isoform X3 [Harpegnathos saltator]
MLVHVGQQPECLLLTMIGMLVSAVTVYHHRRTQHTVILTSCYWHNIYSGVAELDSEKKVRLLLQTSLTFCDWDENPFEKCFRGLQQLVGSSMISSAFTTSISQRLNQVVTWKVAESGEKEIAQGRRRGRMQAEIGRDRKRWKYSRVRA